MPRRQEGFKKNNILWSSQWFFVLFFFKRRKMSPWGNGRDFLKFKRLYQQNITLEFAKICRSWGPKMWMKFESASHVNTTHICRYAFLNPWQGNREYDFTRSRRQHPSINNPNGICLTYETFPSWSGSMFSFLLPTHDWITMFIFILFFLRYKWPFKSLTAAWIQLMFERTRKPLEWRSKKHFHVSSAVSTVVAPLCDSLAPPFPAMPVEPING